MTNTVVSLRKVKSTTFNNLNIKDTFILEDEAVDPRDRIRVFIKISDSHYREIGIVDPDKEDNKGIYNERHPEELFVVPVEVIEVAVTYREK
jgi:hypothetical protein